MKHVRFLVLIFGLIVAQRLISAQGDLENKIVIGEAVGVIMSTQQRLVRIVDRDNKVVCYVLSDGKSAPSCVAIH
jgi:hypothetical protein